MIDVQSIKKIYNLSKKQMAKEKTKEKTKIAVNDISFVAKPNQIFGLLGPNGAGKTTTLRCIATLLKPTEGNIFVNGTSVLEAPEKTRQNIGFLTNELKLDTHFTPKYTIQYFGKLYGLTDEEINERRTTLFQRFDITKFQDMRISELSTGMKQKLSIAVSLIHNPDIIIFDEPTNGLDIVTARTVTDYLVELKNQGKTVIISTHIMNVAEKLCDHIAIIIDGEIRAIGTTQDIYNKTNTTNLEDSFFELYKTYAK